MVDTEQNVIKSVYEQTPVRRFETVLFPENAELLKKDMVDNGWTIIEVSNPGRVVAEKEEINA